MGEYAIYENEHGCFIVETFSKGWGELYDIEKDLLEHGFVITNIDGRFIKCYKVGR